MCLRARPAVVDECRLVWICIRGHTRTLFVQSYTSTCLCEYHTLSLSLIFTRSICVYMYACVCCPLAITKSWYSIFEHTLKPCMCELNWRRCTNFLRSLASVVHSLSRSFFSCSQLHTAQHDINTPSHIERKRDTHAHTCTTWLFVSLEKRTHTHVRIYTNERELHFLTMS